MPKNPGKIVRFIRKDGTAQYGIAYDSQQTPAIAKSGRLVFVLVDTDYEPMLDKDTGKKLVGMKHAKDLKFLGFVD